MTARQSKHTPIRQYGPRGAPVTGVVRQASNPAASNAAATVSPSRAGKVRPSIVTSTARAAAAASGSLLNIEALR